MKHTIDIPDNYKVIEDHCVLSGDSAKVILILEKEGKKFEDYVREYFKDSRDDEEIGTFIINDDLYCLSNRFYCKQYSCIPFAFKIGLFKCICDDLGFGWLGVLYSLKTNNYISCLDKIKNIIPKEFLDSILK